MSISGGIQFKFGLISGGNKYLTAETFGFKIAASGNNLKKKQIWALEQQDGTDVHIKSCLGRYLSADKNGKVSCDAEEPGAETAFQVESTSDGRWALKSSKYGRYFGGKDDNLSCFEQTISPAYLWSVHLAMHPQVLIFNDRQKSYAHVFKDQEVHMSKRTPWGVDTLCTLVYRNKGYYIVTSNNHYLKFDGTLEKTASEKSIFTIEFYSGKIAFKSKSNALYLAPFGPKGRLETKKSKPGKDEYFTLEDSNPQITLFSKTKSRYVSGKQGLQLSANQDEAEETEILQMEIDKTSDKVYFRNGKDKYIRAHGQSIQADAASKADDEAAFTVEWHGRVIRLLAANGKYVSIKPSGHLIAVGNDPEDFVLRLVNRPLIVLRGEYGFMGCRDMKLEGNRANYDIFHMEECDGAYNLKAPNGKYLVSDGEHKLAANGKDPQPFLIQLCKNSRMAIKPENGIGYVKSDHVGYMTATQKEINKSCLWEY